MRLLIPTLLTAALLLISKDASFASAHDLLGDGCLLGNFPDVTRRMKPVPAVLYSNMEPVQGLHLTLDRAEGLRVTWMNPASPSSGGKFSPVCLYGARGSNLSHVATGYFYTYTAGMFTHTLNSARLDFTGFPCLNISTSACVKVLSYKCGDKAFGFSPLLHVHLQGTAVPLKPGPQMAVVGDMGLPHGLMTIHSIAARMSNRSTGQEGVNMLLHAGDITYADDYGIMSHNNSYVWVDYMNALQGVASRVPYMTAPGNHEAEFDFAAYLNWLPMPYNASSSDSPFWFSFDYLGVHILSFSTEHDFGPNSTQWRWIEQDLKHANENRAHVPWVVLIGHRPLYCSSLICYARCHHEARIYRSYLEDLLNQHHVDVVLSGHNHQYERSYPVYDGKATQKNYLNPQAPVYIVNGAAGNPELNDPTFEPFVDWRAAFKASMRTGFLLMTPSKSQLKFDYVMSDTDEVYDSFTLIRT